MFGYVVINKPEMKLKDYEVYRSFYCGLCRELRERYGISGQLSLTYDMTFVILLLGGLYEPPTSRGKTRCAIHPVCSQPVRRNAFTEYAAGMNILLVYYKCMDDWKDEKKLLRLLYARLLKGRSREFVCTFAKKWKRIRRSLEEISRMEKAGEKDLDRISGEFGKIMGEILALREDEWEPSLFRFGFFLGKFIYLLDAYEDVEKDQEKGNYNPFSDQYIMKEFEEQVRELLMLMMAEACREFEKLPIIKYGDILRNILYSGVWCRFETVSAKRREAKEKKDDGSVQHSGSVQRRDR